MNNVDFQAQVAEIQAEYGMTYSAAVEVVQKQIDDVAEFHEQADRIKTNLQEEITNREKQMLAERIGK